MGKNSFKLFTDYAEILTAYQTAGWATDKGFFAHETPRIRLDRFS